MAQAEPVWEIHDEAEKMVAALVQKYPERFGHITDPEIFGCAAITGKDKPESQIWDAQVEGIKEPSALWSKKVYCIKFYKMTWDNYAPSQRQHMLFRLLERIPEKCDGKVLPYDLQDSYALVKEYGPDYMKKTDLPDLLLNKKDFVQSKKDSEEGKEAGKEVKE